MADRTPTDHLHSLDKQDDDLVPRIMGGFCIVVVLGFLIFALYARAQMGQ